MVGNWGRRELGCRGACDGVGLELHLQAAWSCVLQLHGTARKAGDVVPEATTISATEHKPRFTSHDLLATICHLQPRSTSHMMKVAVEASEMREWLRPTH
ncbi:hypothetical protein CDV31_008892 [Fusarium ambrosium]|uniref:Uncharacterized protein n=1 Tax=Fusarium ambrosium TaxID=131363 RepID=A0A428TY43_9HYPO|nr:hypothetical protein CDV31_008892 [Fusarium ambrosium]